jgi:hypothetical protein
VEVKEEVMMVAVVRRQVFIRVSVRQCLSVHS